jgi:hypothetical protein
VSGPHDFAVREGAARPRKNLRSALRVPASRVVTIAIRPSFIEAGCEDHTSVFQNQSNNLFFREGLDRLSRTSRDLPDGQARGRPTESQEAHAKDASSPPEGARNRLRADPSRLRGAGAGSRGDVPAIISRTLRLPLFELQPSLCLGGRVIHLRRGCLRCDKPPQRQGGWPAATFCA